MPQQQDEVPLEDFLHLELVADAMLSILIE